jgi:glycerate kinase
MRVLLAFDKFKDSLTAPAACAAASSALRARHPDWTIDECPLADGGEGFCDILTRAAGGVFVSALVTGPRGAQVEGRIGLVAVSRVPEPARALLQIPALPPGSEVSAARIAVIEMASASGLALLSTAERDLWQTTTAGTGELIHLAASHGAVALLLGVGGSATNDLGLGALDALGLRCLSGSGQPVSPPVPARWREIARMTGGVPRGLPPLRIACDVTNPLLGSRGAAAVYGPQKGLRTEDLARLDHQCARLGLMLCAHSSRPDSLMDAPGAGAAGGIAFGLMAAAGARLLPGFDLVSAWLDLDSRLAAADLVITGEGRFDDSSLQGKGPGAVASRALALGKPVQVFAGRASVAQPPPQLRLHSITPPDLPLTAALSRAGELLAHAVREAI